MSEDLIRLNNGRELVDAAMAAIDAVARDNRWGTEDSKEQLCEIVDHIYHWIYRVETEEDHDDND